MQSWGVGACLILDWSRCVAPGLLEWRKLRSSPGRWVVRWISLLPTSGRLTSAGLTSAERSSALLTSERLTSPGRCSAGLTSPGLTSGTADTPRRLCLTSHSGRSTGAELVGCVMGEHITRDSTGAVVLIETSTASLRVVGGVLYLVIETEDGGEVRGRFDAFGLSAWHKPPERLVETAEPVELPSNVIKWGKP